jgi:hypothetical protein
MQTLTLEEDRVERGTYMGHLPAVTTVVVWEDDRAAASLVRGKGAAHPPLCTRVRAPSAKGADPEAARRCRMLPHTCASKGPRGGTISLSRRSLAKSSAGGGCCYTAQEAEGEGRNEPRVQGRPSMAMFCSTEVSRQPSI